MSTNNEIRYATLHANALTPKGAMRPAVREAIRDAIAEVRVTLKDGRSIVLHHAKGNLYIGELVQCDDAMVYARCAMAISTNGNEPTEEAANETTFTLQ